MRHQWAAGLIEGACQVCGSTDTFLFPTHFALYRLCRSCGERQTLRPEQPAITIRDISDNTVGDPFRESLNDLSKVRYENDEEERIHEANQGG
jgi:hypothetical protein